MGKNTIQNMLNECPRKLDDSVKTLRCAEKGDGLAMLMLGKHYLYFDIHEEGHNYEESVQALYWLSKAAETHVWIAYYWLAYEVDLLRQSMGFGGEKYFIRYRDKAMQVNPVYKDIINRLKQDGYTKEMRNTFSRDNFEKINAAYLFFYDFNLLYYRGYSYRCDDITSCYLKKAAEHGCSIAQKAIAIGYRECWEDWCNDILKLEPKRATEYLKDKGINITEIKGFYESAKKWFLKAGLAGEDIDSELIALLESKKNLDKLDRIGAYNVKKEIVRIRSIEMELPYEIKNIIQEMRDYALREENKWYESLGGVYWVVKSATEEFTYDNTFFVLYPEVVCETQAFFEHIMIHKFESKLLELGATNIRCTGMLD